MRNPYLGERHSGVNVGEKDEWRKYQNYVRSDHQNGWVTKKLGTGVAASAKIFEHAPPI